VAAEKDNAPRPFRRYRTGDALLDSAIDQVVAMLPEGDPRRTIFLREIMTTACKLALDQAATGDVRLMNSALKELRHAFKVFAPWRHVRKVTVFGSARTPEGAPAYEQARVLGESFARQGWMMITGAGGGIMAAAHGGAGRDASFGVNIQLPFEQAANETVRGDDKLVNFKYFFTRKLTFLKETDGIVLFPGGYGTHDEGFETLTLVQTGKTEPLPIVFVEPPGSGYWREWRAYVERHLRDPGLISPDDVDLFRITDDVDSAVQEIVGFYRVYHSLRYVGPKLVLRLLARLSPSRIEELEREFAPLVKSGRMELLDALPEEGDQPEIAHLPRLVFHHRRDDYAMLRRLIDRINETPDDQRTSVAMLGPRPDLERAERGATPQSAAADGEPLPRSGA